MIEKKSILLASTAALTLVGSALSAPTVAEPVPPTETQSATNEPAAPAAGEGPIPALAPLIRKSAGAPEQRPASHGHGTPEANEPTAVASPSQPTSPEAIPSEVPMTTPSGPAAPMSEPPSPPQMTMPGASGARSAGMTAEERNALREQRFQKMRERIMQRRQEMVSRWDSYWKILDGMTPEQKEAVQAVFGRGRPGCAYKSRSPRTPFGMPRQPMDQSEFGFPTGSNFRRPGFGYGYGPQGAEPYPYEWGSVAPWFGEQPMSPASAQPWHGPDQETLQGPPPPSVDFPQP